MRKLLVALSLVAGLGLSAHAAGSLVPDRIYEVGIASGINFHISVSTSVVTQMDNPTLAGRVSVFVQNLDASANLWCGYNNIVSSSTGVEILKGGNFLTFGMLDKSGQPYGANALHIWCTSDGSGSTNAAIAQSY